MHRSLFCSDADDAQLQADLAEGYLRFLQAKDENRRMEGTRLAKRNKKAKVRRHAWRMRVNCFFFLIKMRCFRLDPRREIVKSFRVSCGQRGVPGSTQLFQANAHRRRWMKQKAGLERLPPMSHGQSILTNPNC